jgi:hypothetical protein
MELQEGGAIMQTTPWVVVEADDKQTIQREFGQGEIVDKFPSKDHAVFLVQSPKLPPLPNTVLQGQIYGVGASVTSGERARSPSDSQRSRAFERELMTADVIRIVPRGSSGSRLYVPHVVEGAPTVHGVGRATAPRDVLVSLGHGTT